MRVSIQGSLACCKDPWILLLRSFNSEKPPVAFRNSLFIGCKAFHPSEDPLLPLLTYAATGYIVASCPESNLIARTLEAFSLPGASTTLRAVILRAMEASSEGCWTTRGPPLHERLRLGGRHFAPVFHCRRGDGLCGGALATSG